MASRNGPRQPGRSDQAPPASTRPRRPASNTNAGGLGELEATRQQLREALEQQAAIAEVLRAIAGSPADLQPVLDAIAASAAKLCVAEDAAIVLLRPEPPLEWSARSTYVAAHDGAIPPITADQPLDRWVVSGRSVLERRTIHVEDILAGPDEYPVSREQSRRLGVRTVLATPLLREGPPIGAVLLRRTEVRPFTDRQIDLLRTFADQAVVAIENVRLFTETKEALERQTAVGEILRAIAGSPTDIRPVLEAITASAIRFCAAEDALVMLPEGHVLRLAAHTGPVPIPDSLSYPLDGTSMSATAFAQGRVLHTTDLQAEAASYPAGAANARESGYHTVLVAPLLREGTAIGTIGLRRADARPFTDRQIDLLRTFADQAVIAIENVRLFNETRDALERQRATADILYTISTSPTTDQPVLEAVARNALRFCGAEDVIVVLVDGDWLELRAHAGAMRVAGEQGAWTRLPLVRETVSGRATLESRTIHVPDIQSSDEFPIGREIGERFGERANLAAPLLRQGKAIGAILLRRTDLHPFGDDEVALAEGFAAQAVIAIENVRLFNETKESLERQTATSEVLRVISTSTSELQPVFEAVVRKANDLCEAEWSLLWLRRDDGFHLAAGYGIGEEFLASQRDRVEVVGRGSVVGRTALEREPVHVADILTDPDYIYPEDQRLGGFRTALGVPIRREHEVVGVIALSRNAVRPFSDLQIRVVQTFADQAAIAIENVRLFNETKESLERQTALAEILRVISRSPTDVQPVLDAIAENALRFCAAGDAVIMLPRDDHLQLSAHRGAVPVASDLRYPNDGTSVSSRAFLEARTIAVQDLQTAIDLPLGAENARSEGYHAIVGAPLLHAGAAVGVIVLRRFDARPFSEREIGALETFAAQAVVAIENTRLFNETKEALERQTALAEILRVIARSPTDVQPVLDAIAESAARFCAAEDASVGFMDGELWRIRAHHGPIEIILDPAAIGASGRIGPTFVSGRSMIERRTIHVPDLLAAADEYPEGAAASPTTRAILATPLLTAAGPVGALFLRRTEATPFTERQIELAETFAAQAVIAIENVRLFNEIRAKSGQLEVANDELAAASRHKSEFLANMSHELRTPLNAIIGFSDVLEQRLFGELNDRQADYTHDIASSGRHLLDLVNEILDLSKVEAGKMALEPSEFDLADTIRGAVGFVRERAAAHRIEVATDLPADLGTAVADERKVRQVLLNLLSNAVKFTSDGGTITVRAQRTAGEVEVSVGDTGIGIAPEDQAKVFDEFQQVGKASDRSREGTGLGLTLAKRFVELHGGRIWVESEIGTGTTFTFAIPVARAAASPG